MLYLILIFVIYSYVFFFFKQKTAYEMRISDWSSDVCSSDLSSLEAFDRLTTEQRALLLWVSVEGLSYQQVADILDVPTGTVMSRISRARQPLRQPSAGENTRPALRLLN